MLDDESSGNHLHACMSLQVMAVLDLQSSPYLAQRVTHLAWRSGCRELCAVLADLVQQEHQLWGHYDDGAGDHTVDGGISSVGGMSQQQQFPASQLCRSLEAAAASHSHSRNSHSFQPATACGASATANDSSSSSTAVPKAAPVAATLVPLPLGNLVSLSLEMWQHAPELGELDEAAPWVFGHTFSTECTTLCRQDTGHIGTALAGDTNGVSTNARGASWSHRESPNEGMAVHRARQLVEQAHAVYDPWVTLRMQKPLQHLRLAAWSAALHAKDCAIQHEINPSVQTNVTRTKRLLACIPKVDLVMYNMCFACVRELFDGSRSSSSSSPGSTSHASIIRQCSRCTRPEPPRLSEGSLHSHVHVQPQRWLAPKPPLVSLHLGGSYEWLPGLLAALAGWETLEAVRLIPYYTQGAPTLGAVSR